MIEIKEGNGITGQSSMQELMDRYAAKEDLQAAINNIDKSTGDHQRIFLMGCGRSGTWLLTALFTTFGDFSIIPKEVPIQYFGIISTKEKNLLLKRHFTSYCEVENIPDSVKVIWIVRHPYAVLTSHNPHTKLKYHIKPFNFLGWMLSLRYLIETNNVAQIIRYEDLVTDPVAIQNQIANTFNLNIIASPDEITSRFKAPEEATSAMHGLRKIDAKSINKYLDDEEKVAYLKEIMPRVHPVLDWMSETFGYDMHLPD